MDTIEQSGQPVTITIPNSPFAALTSREAQVARLLCSGWRNADIADELQISVKTIDTHRAKVLKKLGAENNTRLLILALREQFLTLDDVDPRRKAAL